MASILILAGIALTIFGLWLIRKSLDPLGNFPPMAPLPMLIGMALMLAGLVWRYWP